MTSPELSAFLRPGAVAIVGASDDPRRIGGRPLAFSLAAGFAGRLYPVNPNREWVQGLRAYPSLSAIPEEIDLAVIALPAADVLAAVKEAAARGARATIVFSAGFAETGEAGSERQNALVEASRAAGMRLLGPNCVGLFNAGLGHVATFSSAPEAGLSPNGRVALVSQSGAYGTHLLTRARQRRIEIGQWVSTGNEADVSAGEVLDAFAHDDAVDVIAACLEGVKDGAAFLRALRVAHEAGKPVALMKIGRSAAGAAAAAAHTASLAGEDVVFDAAIAEFGACRVDNTDDMFDLVYGLSRAPLPRGPNLGVITISGGAGVIMADAAEAEKLVLPPLAADRQARLLARTPFASTVNPVDITAQAMNDFSMVGDFLAELVEQQDFDSFAAFFTTWGGSPVLGPKLRVALGEGSAALAGRPMALVILADDEVVRAYETAGFLVFDDPTRAVRVLGRMAAIGGRLATGPLPAPVIEDGPRYPPFPTGSINEREGKAILAAIGIPVLRERLATNSQETAETVEDFGCSVALKLVSADIAHKSDIGGVILGVEGADGGRAAWQKIMEAVAHAAPHARIDGVSVAPMAGEGVELIVAVRRDPVFGPVTVAGFGGLFVEIMRDVAMRVGPVTPAQALAMLHALKGSAILSGARGRPSYDMAAAALAIAQLSAYADAHRDRLDAIEINPLLVQSKGVVALDVHFASRPPGAT